ncbi:MAG: hypothetical protein IJS05_04805 [Paludibacteraceae bacterium]|nr:hypothetical protein [Paludibacteraceae bacterium]
MKKTLLIAAIMMAMVMSVSADETKCNFTLYVESDVESDNLNEELTFDAWKILAGINIKYKTSSHRSDNEQGIFYVGDEIQISVYGYFYTFAGWSDGWTGDDPNFIRDITLTEDLYLGIMVSALDLQVKAYSSDDNLGSAIGSFAISNNSQETFKGTDMLSDKCTFAFFAEPSEGGKFLGWVSDVMYQVMKKDASETVFNEWLAETIKNYEDSQTDPDIDPAMKELNQLMLSPYIELNTEELMILNSIITFYDKNTGIFGMRAIFGSEPTGLENVEQGVNNQTSAQKVMREESVYIIRDNKTYNVLGAEVK